MWRIEDEWEQAASLQLRARDPHGVDMYHTRRRVLGYRSGDELNEAVARWIIGAKDREADVLVSVATNREADDLNNAVQNLLAQDRNPDAAEVVLHWSDKTTGTSRPAASRWVTRFGPAATTGGSTPAPATANLS